MALSQSSTCTQVSTLVHAELARPHSPKSQATVPSKADSVASTVLRSTAGLQTRSMAAAAPAPPKASAIALKSLNEVDSSPDDELVRQISDDFEDSAARMRVRRSSGKNSAARTSRRRALVMCLALGMVRPVTAASRPSGLHRSPSSGFTVKSGSLASQVSIASSLKAAKLLEDKDDESPTL